MRLAWALLVALLVVSLLPAGAAQGRRVVDVVTAGDSASERAHDFAGDCVTGGTIDGRPYWQTRGWLSYALAVYEDTEVTLACTFRGSEGRTLPFDLLVEGRKIATHRFASPSSAPVSVEIRVPFSLTRGLTSIFIMLRAVDGPTPGLLDLRTVQEHLERPLSRAARPTGATFW